MQTYLVGQVALKLLGHYRHKIESLCIDSNRSRGGKVASDIFLAFYKLRKKQNPSSFIILNT